MNCFSFSVSIFFTGAAGGTTVKGDMVLLSFNLKTDVVHSHLLPDH